MRTRRFAVSLAAGIAALSLAACGGGSDSGSGKPASPKAQFIRQANAICRDQASKSPEFPGSKSGSGYVTTASQVIPYLEEVSKLSKASLRRLSALTPPAGQKAAAERLLAAQRERVEGLEDALAAARKGDGKRFTAAFQRDQKTNGPRYLQAAAQLGLTACG